MRTYQIISPARNTGYFILHWYLLSSPYLLMTFYHYNFHEYHTDQKEEYCCYPILTFHPVTNILLSPLPSIRCQYLFCPITLRQKIPGIPIDMGFSGDSIFIYKISLLAHLFYKLLQADNTFSSIRRLRS